MPTKNRVPAVDGWFTIDDDQPALLGSRCTSCGTYSFPRQTYFCANPACTGREFDEVELSRRGTLWSYTNNSYQPPPPYVPVSDPFEPFAIAAVELATEQLVVLGQVVTGVGVADLQVGTEMELVLDTLFEDDDNDFVVWKWQPTTSGGSR
jgi:uncharacterized OB-fold protein